MTRKCDGDADLGLGRPIERRDFLHGVLIGSGGALMGGVSPTLARAAVLEAAAQDQPGYYPQATRDSGSFVTTATRWPHAPRRAQMKSTLLRRAPR